MTGRGDAIPATRSPRQPGRPGTTVGRVLPGLAVVGLTAIGAALRLPALTDAGLWRDDAWVALVGRVGPGMAWDMSATAPLFTAGMWAWLHLGDRMVAWWAQLPPMALGIAVGLKNGFKQGIGSAIGAVVGGIILSLIIANVAGFQESGNQELEQRGIVSVYGR